MASDPTLTDRVQDLAIRGLLGLILALPYRRRVTLMGTVCARVVAPALGWRRRIRDNLAHAWPELPASEVDRLVGAVPDNVGRTLIEIYSGAEFKAHVAGTPLTGPGLDALRAARDRGRPVVLVTAHLGNFDALRAALFHQGFPLGALYRPMNNPCFNTHYVAALEAIGTPLWPNKRRGVTQFVRHIAGGGAVGILTDVFSRKGADVTFFDRSAPTSVSACDWALKYGAEVIPCHGFRQPDGLSFEVRLDAPVPHSDAVTMTQAINDNLETHVRRHPEQWFWIHRRWKPERRRKGRTQHPSTG